MSVEDFEYIKDGVKIIVPVTKNNVVRQFVLAAGEESGVNLIDIFKRYVSLRPAGAPANRLFIGFRLGKCTKQPIGLHTIGSYPQRIATYLKLPNPKEYTGHCFRRSSASLLADTGVNITVLKQHGGWKSDKVAYEYIENSLNQKRQIAASIMGSDTGPCSSSDATSLGIVNVDSQSNSVHVQGGHDSNINIIATQTNVSRVETVAKNTSNTIVNKTVKAPLLSGVSFDNLSHCTINVYAKPSQ